MNFLAHLCLSGNNERIMVGNFIGDFVKGRGALAEYDPEIARGIELHRAIDVYTDKHPVVAISKQRLRPKYRHYAGVIVDMFYDHLLARKWADYHPTPLPEFADYAYGVMEEYAEVLPSDARFMLRYMKRDNWLVSYAQYEGIRRALQGMARRTRFNSQLEKAPHDLRQHDEAFENEFRVFFPELQTYCRTWLAPNRN